MKKMLALSILAASAGANALTLGTDPVEVTLTMSGATAQDPALFETLTGAAGLEPNPVCTGDIDVYTTVSSNEPSQGSYAVFCETSEGNTLFRKFAGGSATSPQGVCGTLADVTWTQIQESDAASCDAPVTGTGAAAGLDVSYNCSATDSTVSNGGVSDLEINRLLEFNTICEANGVALDINAATNGVIFGIAATNDLYVALQQTQGLNTDVNGNGTADAFESYADLTGFEAAFEANMPSLTRAQIAGIPQNQIQDWSAFGLPDQNAGSSTDDLTKWCTRNTSSGTRASLEAKITQSTCAGDVATLQDNTPSSGEGSGSAFTDTSPSGTPPFGAPSCESSGDACIVNVASSGRMDECLTAWQNNGGSNGTWAMGYQASDRDLDSSARQWNYIKVDGWAPTVANAITGEYPFTVEANLIAANLNASQNAVYQQLVTGIQSPAFLDNPEQKFGTAGFYATTDNGDCTASGNIACGGYALSGSVNSCNFLMEDPLP